MSTPDSCRRLQALNLDLNLRESRRLRPQVRILVGALAVVGPGVE
jgi:hypothetical protein